MRLARNLDDVDAGHRRGPIVRFNSISDMRSSLTHGTRPGFAVAFISKPILYELDAITHPLHDQPRPESKREAKYVTVTDLDLLPFEEVEGFNTEGVVDGDLGGELEGQLKGEGYDEPVVEVGVETVAKEASPSTQAHQLRTWPLGASGDDAAESAACATRDARLTLTEEVQAELYTLNHPRDCGAALLLECDSSKGLDQGTGSRLFYLTRCGLDNPDPPNTLDRRRLVAPLVPPPAKYPHQVPTLTGWPNSVTAVTRGLHTPACGVAMVPLAFS